MADQVTSNSNIKQKRAAEFAQEKGASSWLTVLPLQGHGFHLHKNSFRDERCLRYGWLPKNLTDQCPCGSAFTVEHSLSFPKGGFPTICHNEIRDLLAELIRDVCPNVETEPSLQHLNGEAFKYRSTTTDDEARLDIAANGFWGGRFERKFYDVRVFNPYASSYLSTDISTCYRQHELDKKRKYEDCIRLLEQGTFTPIILSCTGGCSKLTDNFIKRLSSLTAEKTDLPYSVTANCIRCRVGFALIRAAVMCLRGYRSKYTYHQTSNILLATAESGLS